MIFNNNSTSLGAMDIPMAEGYDCGTGCALALIESARNDLAMFKGFLATDAREMSLTESADITALQEATGAGIIQKIKDLFTKLVAKIKAIFHTLMAKLNGLAMKDKDLVKKYEKELYRKTNLGNMEIKWAKIDNSPSTANAGDTSNAHPYSSNDYNAWKSDSSERFEYYAERVIGTKCDESEASEKIRDLFFKGEPETVELKEVTTIRVICSFITGYAKNIKDMDSANKKITKSIEDTIKELDKEYKDTYKNMNNDQIKMHTQQYDMAVSYQSVILKFINGIKDCAAEEYKQYKAALVKAIAVNDKKLEESAVYAEAIAEAAANEVTDVISAAVTKEEWSQICNASKNVLDGNASDDPFHLNYEKVDYYTADRNVVGTDGKVKSDIKGTCNESFFDNFDFI